MIGVSAATQHSSIARPTMKTNLFSQHPGRMALALATAIALTLPGSAGVMSGQAASSSRTAKETNMSAFLQADRTSRVDGVALALVTRPAASLTSPERRGLADRYSDRIIAANTDL